MNGITAAIYASLMLGIGEAAIKKSYRELSPSIAYAFAALLGVVLWIPLALIFGGSFQAFLTVFPYALVSAVFSEAFYFFALSKGKLSVTATILSSYPIYTIGFSYLINGERLGSLEALFVWTAIAGTLLACLPAKTGRNEKWRRVSLWLWPLAAAVAAGFSDTISKSIINQTSSFDFLLALAIAQLPVAAGYLLLEKQGMAGHFRAIYKHPRHYFQAIVGAILSTAGVALLWISFNSTLASIASPIVATSGALIVLIAALFMDETMTLKQGLGILLVFIAVLGLSSVSVEL